MSLRFPFAPFATLALWLTIFPACAFEGRILAVAAQGGQPLPLLYLVGTNYLRVEMTDTNLPGTVDLLDRNTDAVTLVFPGSRSFMHLKSAAPAAGPAMPALAPSSAIPGVPRMPALPLPPMEKLELLATGQTTNLLGFACRQFQLRQRGETMEIWATDQLFPFQPYLQNQPRRSGPVALEAQWPGLVKDQNLFPLLVKLKSADGAERICFEVKSVLPRKLSDDDANLFQPPAGFFEIQPLDF